MGESAFSQPRILPVPPVFHTVENFFPHCGKIPACFSMPWKIRKKSFHAVENPEK